MSPTGLQLIVRYGLFAALSIVGNLVIQALVLALLRSAQFALMFAMGAGTLAGFALKYALDKRWIFDSRPDRLGQEVRQIALYGVFSVATTLIFWATETAFAMVWRTTSATYLGGMLGLCAGYVLKYLLDRRYTFGKVR